MSSRQEIRGYFVNLQEAISSSVAKLNGLSCQSDLWHREGGGGGDTRVFSGGEFLEKGGVNFSEVFGELSPEFAKTLPHGEGNDFYATGISLVLHPTNPFVPTVHANFRYLERGSVGWFGGGADLTPCYFFREDAVHFHQTYSNALKAFGDLYPDFKKKCDEYFYLPHRGETRGVGGIFFDYQLVNADFAKKNGIRGQVFDMVRSCGDAFLESYLPIVRRRMTQPFSEREKEFQEIRRGRYVEFNLLYDRGTLFGLKTNGRVESILMSLPLKARWVYDFQPEPGSREAEIYKYLRPTDWI